jgi:hypothetical protein
MTSMRSSSAGGIGIEQVGCGDEHDLGEIKGHLQVMIGEGMSSARVQNLEQRCRRIAAKVHAQLVDLVEHEHRIARPGAAHGLDDAPRQCADVGAPVPANLGFVAHTAQAHAHKLSPQRLGDGDPARSCPCPAARQSRGSGSSSCPPPVGARRCAPGCAPWPWAAHSGSLQDALGFLDIQIVIRQDTPGQGQQPVKVGADDAHLRGRCRDAIKPR